MWIIILHLRGKSGHFEHNLGGTLKKKYDLFNELNSKNNAEMGLRVLYFLFS